jgi:hypothetical protein
MTPIVAQRRADLQIGEASVPLLQEEVDVGRLQTAQQ